ncbi:potassium transporter Kup [Xanthomonas campestris pv. campestris]|uniref:potassium transporter Kup n=1 Tax=Xanthomonas campestris TaxID=339 RepID=UPI002AD461EC|nr:potassium transporter Kup [Xanthomonas campestris]MEA0656038.1 potassium transporter Kup [Xanthomonas campestris pv. campestris]MEA0660047.1 potassium transporter Kup [Xanthomonas campestris pv. campestris]MEA0755575.1 potassium transporter Kup [Xanthomonas campestris pv. campestris]MEA0796991.1 potassium transporter Kup [Xanthomonas campestris pv. campestris]MEA0817452.1 potassium transporter Kup [Xanthomonas campestris pv. campestris]
MSHTPTPAAGSGHAPANGHMALVIGAIGVVFGDIGTSPLYTLKEAFSPHYGLTSDHDTVLGVLSLAFWALMITVTLKYVTIIMRADNEGEGGIMALMALTQRTLKQGSRSAYVVGILGIFGASLFFGDGVITPAISVMGAVEGLEIAAPSLHPFIVPITVVVLLVVFMVQRFGTEKVGKVFGPITCLWFLSLGAIGIWNIVDAPEVLKAFNPWWAIRFFMEHGWHGVFILGAVVLAVTGGEALYADMGHFGARPIRHGWYFFVLPMLLLNYLGQGALVLNHPAALKNPFFEAVPSWALYPMIILATLAAVIASQAVITGAYSVARQAMQLGYIPRMLIKHTSRDTIGQIYVPGINWLLMVMVIALVLIFRSSTNLAVAYGISVSMTMLIDTLLLALVARSLWPRWRNWVLPLCVVFFIIELAFVIANGAKLLQGAWFPLALGIVVFTLMRTWRRGRALLREEIRKDGIRIDSFLPGLMLAPPARVPGMAVFLTTDPMVVPHALMHNLKHNKVLHERNIFLNVDTLPIPYAPADKRLQIESIGDEFYRVYVRFGFMETPDVPLALMRSCDQGGIHFDPMDTTFFASRETIVASANRGMPIWRDKLFALMHRNAAPATGFFRIPGNRLVELGAQVEI